MISKRKNYISLSSAVFVSNIGNGLNNIILGKVLYDKTGSIFSFGIMLVIEHLFNLMLGAWSGFYVDRNDKKKICVVSDATRGFSIILSTLLYFYSDNYLWILAGVLCNNIIKPFNRAASFALPVEVFSKDDLFKFNLWMNIALQAGYLIGASLVFPILKYKGTYIAFYTNGLSYLLSAWLISQVHSITQLPLKKETDSDKKILSLFFDEWVYIYNFLKTSKEVVLLAIFSSVGFLVIAVFNLLLVPIVNKNFNSDQKWLSYLEIIFAFGTILSGYFFKLQFDFKKFIFFNLGTSLFILIWFILLKFNAHIFLISLFVFIMGAVLSVHISSAFTLIQQKVISEKLGKFSTVKRNIHSVVIAGAILILTSFSKITLVDPIDLAILLFIIISILSYWILNKFVPITPK